MGARGASDNLCKVLDLRDVQGNNKEARRNEKRRFCPSPSKGIHGRVRSFELVMCFVGVFYGICTYFGMVSPTLIPSLP